MTMQTFIGPVHFQLICFVAIILLAPISAESQFSQDFRSSNGFGGVRFPGSSSTRPRTQFVAPRPKVRIPQQQQQPFQPSPLASSFRPSPQPNTNGGFAPQPSSSSFASSGGTGFASSPANNAGSGFIRPSAASQNAAQAAAQLTLATQSPRKPTSQKQQPEPTAFLTNFPPLPGVPSEDFLDFDDSRRIRISPDLQEQRDIANYQEFLLLQGSSALFLERPRQPPPGALNAAAANAPAPLRASNPIQPSAPASEGFRSFASQPTSQQISQLPPSRFSQPAPVQPQFSPQVPPPAPATAYPPASPYAQPPSPAYPSELYDNYAQGDPYSVNPYPYGYTYQQTTGHDAYSFGYDVFQG